MEINKFDLIVIGAGSGGFAATLTAARNGLSVLLVERNTKLGGNAVHGGVHNWEPGMDNSGIARELYNRMRLQPGQAAVWSMGRHFCWPDRNTPDFPGGEHLVDDTASYDDTLKRHGTEGLKLDADRVRRQWHGVVFEPESCHKVMREMLEETGTVTLMLETLFQEVVSSNQCVSKVYLQNGLGGKIEAQADFFIDATANLHLCRALGCRTWTGDDPQERYGEPDAPAEASGNINGVSLIYRVRPKAKLGIDLISKGTPVDCPYQAQWPLASVGQYPNGDRNVNMLPTMSGNEFLKYLQSNTLDDAYRIAQDRALGHWHWMQTHYFEFQGYELHWIAPSLGIRETHRIEAEYMLRQQDLVSGIEKQPHDDIIALSDHAMDLHGVHNRGCVELKKPYGIPYRCLIPKHWENLLVACRGAGFSQIAASSCRLSRTMMDLGYAAGYASALAHSTGTNFPNINPAT